MNSFSHESLKCKTKAAVQLKCTDTQWARTQPESEISHHQELTFQVQKHFFRCLASRWNPRRDTVLYSGLLYLNFVSSREVKSECFQEPSQSFKSMVINPCLKVQWSNDKVDGSWDGYCEQHNNLSNIYDMMDVSQCKSAIQRAKKQYSTQDTINDHNFQIESFWAQSIDQENTVIVHSGHCEMTTMETMWYHKRK